MRFLKKIFFLALAFLFLPRLCFAADKSSEEFYQEFLTNHRSYQAKISPYNTAKSRHQSYQSITSRAEYLEAAKALLLPETRAIISYANMVRKRLAEATRILNYEENLYFIRLDDEISALSIMENKIDGLSSLSDLQTFWNDLDNHFRKVSRFGYLTKSLIEDSSALKIFDNLKITKEKIDGFVSEKLSTSSAVKAAKDKLSVSEKELGEVNSLLIKAREIRKNASGENDFKDGSVEVKKIVDQVISKIGKLISDYQNIVETIIRI